jgi:hypothetical protein
MLGERQGVQDFQRLSGAERGTDRIALLIGKGIRVNKLLRLYDFAINKFAPHFMAIRGSLTAEKDTRAEIQLDDIECETFGTPPLTQALRLRKRLEHKLPWRIEGTRDNEFDLVCDSVLVI